MVHSVDPLYVWF